LTGRFDLISRYLAWFQVKFALSQNQANNTPHPMEPYAGDQFSQSQNGVPIGPPDPSKPKLLDQARAILRLHHYSIHTERSFNAPARLT
jgi:hypothetical protein